MSKKESKEESKTFFSKIKEIWNVPRYKALIKLGLYALFFISLFLISQISTYLSPNKKTNTNQTPQSSVFESYTYTYTINKGDDVITYTGTSTSNTSTGIRKINDKVDSYIIDKSTNKTYVNGKEDDTLYVINPNYLSSNYLDIIISKSTNNKYITENNDVIEIKKEENTTKKTYELKIINDKTIIIKLELHKID